MNKNYKTYWKLLANEQKNEARHHFQYCVLKALNAKANNKVEIAKALLRRAFTPVTNPKALGSGRIQFDTVEQLARMERWIWKTKYAQDRQTIFGFDKSLIFKASDEALFLAILEELGNGDRAIRKTEPYYMFLFVRQDISKEQQAVQAAHVAYKAGTKFRADADTTNFVLIGVDNEPALEEAMLLCSEHGYDAIEFNEPDLSDTMTAVAIRPMKEHEKRFLRRYKKLEF